MTSTLGSTFTSISFLDYTVNQGAENKYLRCRSWLIVAFIICSTAIFYFIGNPARVLVFVGALNGLILPIALAILLVAATKKKIIGDYHHPRWLLYTGWLVVLFMAYAGVRTLLTLQL